MPSQALSHCRLSSVGNCIRPLYSLSLDGAGIAGFIKALAGADARRALDTRSMRTSQGQPEKDGSVLALQWHVDVGSVVLMATMHD